MASVRVCGLQRRREGFGKGVAAAEAARAARRLRRLQRPCCQCLPGGPNCTQTALPNQHKKAQDHIAPLIWHVIYAIEAAPDSPRNTLPPASQPKKNRWGGPQPPPQNEKLFPGSKGTQSGSSGLGGSSQPGGEASHQEGADDWIDNDDLDPFIGNPQAQAAISHESDWWDLSPDTTLESEEEIIRRLASHARTIESGGVFLFTRATPQYDARHDEGTAMDVDRKADSPVVLPEFLPVKSPQPKIGRIDGKIMTANELDLSRFGIEVQSIYFHPARQGIGCAVLLKTCFTLRANERLSTALIPLSAGPITSDAKAKESTEDINISSSYPTKTGWFEVDERAGSEASSFKPNIVLNAAGNGVHLGGTGKTKRARHNQSYRIKLDVSKDIIADLPTLLKLKYEDEGGLFYPPSVNRGYHSGRFGGDLMGDSETALKWIVPNYRYSKQCLNRPSNRLQIVHLEKRTNDYTAPWFPFQLNLDSRLRVDIHGSDVSEKLKYFATKASKHEGWCFPIRGSFNPELAKNALQDALANDVLSHVGLRVAAKAWVESSQSPYSFTDNGKERGKRKKPHCCLFHVQSRLDITGSGQPSAYLFGHSGQLYNSFPELS
ncbi:hypothetical protein FIBSPDRAFT_902823 [Athelia psychrophila]|uniref:Uncharacterized protein n=1 Tax=Athelia psychrophila TaxID=1759441 RepID=A0A167WRN3_9AGAM|nr:hypothetical protein FIBSPDRAFT_902823 [Fibularhizoctonia sp. CBS 109695]